MAVSIDPGLTLLLPRDWRELDYLCQDVLEMAGASDADFELHVISDARMAGLMAEHKGVQAPTNTLAFPAESEDSNYLGELYLSAHALQREAFLYGQDPDEHLVRLLTHGLLHLVGFDHGELMESLTESAVENLGKTLPGEGTF